MHLMLYASDAIAKAARISGAGGHVGSKDVARVTVEIGAGPVIAHRRAGISVPGADLDIAQVTGRYFCPVDRTKMIGTTVNACHDDVAAGLTWRPRWVGSMTRRFRGGA